MLIKLGYQKQIKLLPQNQKPSYPQLLTFIQKNFKRLPQAYKLSYKYEGITKEICGQEDLDLLYGLTGNIKIEIMGGGMVEGAAQRDRGRVEGNNQMVGNGSIQKSSLQNLEIKKQESFTSGKAVEYLNQLIKKIKDQKCKIDVGEVKYMFGKTVELLEQRNCKLDEGEKEKKQNERKQKERLEREQEQRKSLELIKKLQESQRRPILTPNPNMPYPYTQNSQPQPQPPQPLQRPPLIHPETHCNACQTSPIQGTRFNCPICPQYNLCSDCQRKKGHQHPLLSIKKVVQGRVRAYVMTKQELESGRIGGIKEEGKVQGKGKGKEEEKVVEKVQESSIKKEQEKPKQKVQQSKTEKAPKVISPKQQQPALTNPQPQQQDLPRNPYAETPMPEQPQGNPPQTGTKNNIKEETKKQQKEREKGKEEKEEEVKEEEKVEQAEEKIEGLEKKEGKQEEVYLRRIVLHREETDQQQFMRLLQEHFNKNFSRNFQPQPQPQQRPQSKQQEPPSPIKPECKLCSQSLSQTPWYKCSKCPNYFLCQECQEKGTQGHGHLFVKCKNKDVRVQGVRVYVLTKEELIGQIEEGEEEGQGEGMEESEEKKEEKAKIEEEISPKKEQNEKPEYKIQQPEPEKQKKQQQTYLELQSQSQKAEPQPVQVQVQSEPKPESSPQPEPSPEPESKPISQQQ